MLLGDLAAIRLELQGLLGHLREAHLALLNRCRQIGQDPTLIGGCSRGVDEIQADIRETLTLQPGADRWREQSLIGRPGKQSGRNPIYNGRLRLIWRWRLWCRPKGKALLARIKQPKLPISGRRHLDACRERTAEPISPCGPDGTASDQSGDGQSGSEELTKGITRHLLRLRGAVRS